MENILVHVFSSRKITIAVTLHSWKNWTIIPKLIKHVPIGSRLLKRKRKIIEYYYENGYDEDS